MLTRVYKYYIFILKYTSSYLQETKSKHLGSSLSGRTWHNSKGTVTGVFDLSEW